MSDSDRARRGRPAEDGAAQHSDSAQGANHAPSSNQAPAANHAATFDGAGLAGEAPGLPAGRTKKGSRGKGRHGAATGTREAASERDAGDNGAKARSNGRARTAGRGRASLPYINRELSSLEFNARVLHEASDGRNPLLERAKFLAIFASNMDEFFQIRVSALMEQAEAHAAPAAGERPPREQLDQIRRRYRELLVEQNRYYEIVRAELAIAGIRIADYDELREHHAALRRRFIDEIYPVLTPLAVDPGHPFPYISSLSLSLAIRMEDPETGEELFARVKVPPLLPRFLQVDATTFVLLEEVIAANLDLLFSGLRVRETHFFRVTRNADLELEEDEADDLLLAIEEELRRRRFGEAVRLEVDRGMPKEMRRLLERGIGVEPEDSYEISGMLDQNALWQVAGLDRPDLRLPSWTPVVPPRLAPAVEGTSVDVFAAIRAGDILVHHPYESFAASVQRFVTQAAGDPDVLSIKMTLYRTSGDSPIVRDLIQAAESGKQVAVLVELKARFDEANNITWARKLEEAGAHVVYGLVGLKTHSKTTLVVRREGGSLRRYVHIGTGNYNPGTARLYTDLGLLSCREELGADVNDLFNVLTGLSRQRSFRRLIVAPSNLRPWFLGLIEREIENAEAGRPARIIVKMNSLVDPACVTALYAASRAGVRVDLIIRGLCSLWPGLAGASENITVRSVVGQFLEHSRIIAVANAGRMEWYIGSADLMERNLDRRVEAMVPIEDLELQGRLGTIIDVMLADNRRSWQLLSDGRWHRTEELDAEALATANAAAAAEGRRPVPPPPGVDTFETMKALAVAAASAPVDPVRPHVQSATIDPRA